MSSVLKLHSIANRQLIIFTSVSKLSITKASLQVCLERTLVKIVIASLQFNKSLRPTTIRSSKGACLFLVQRQHLCYLKAATIAIVTLGTIATNILTCYNFYSSPQVRLNPQRYYFAPPSCRQRQFQGLLSLSYLMGQSLYSSSQHAYYLQPIGRSRSSSFPLIGQLGKLANLKFIKIPNSQ